MSDLNDRKLDRLTRLLDDRGLDEVWLLRPNNVAWLTGGDTVINYAGDAGIAAVGYDGQAVRAVTSNIEAERVRTEEFPADVTVDAFDWYEHSLPEAVAHASSGDAAADLPSVPGFDTVSLGPHRLPFTSQDTRRLERVGAEATEALESVAREIAADDTEREVTAHLHEELARRGLKAPVVLVGGAERSQRYRHFTPTDQPLGDFAHLTIVAVGTGVNVAVTRTVAFDPPEWFEDRHAASARVGATAMAATADAAGDGTAADVFDAIQDGYAEVGYPGEWELHHQGGAIGYEGREWTATPDADYPITAPAPYAWNPTVQGAKSEETVLVTHDDVEVVSTTGAWPTSTYEAVGYDFEISLSDPLYLD